MNEYLLDTANSNQTFSFSTLEHTDPTANVIEQLVALVDSGPVPDAHPIPQVSSERWLRVTKWLLPVLLAGLIPWVANRPDAQPNSQRQTAMALPDAMINPPVVPSLPAVGQTEEFGGEGELDVAEAAAAMPYVSRPIEPSTVLVNGMSCPFHTEFSYGGGWGVPRVGHTHQGLDMMADMGVDLLAIASGTVVRDWNPQGGTVLFLYSDIPGMDFYYAHLSGYNEAVANGQHVNAGDLVAFVGNSGNAITTPPHLHLGMYPNDRDPNSRRNQFADVEPLMRSLCG